MKVGEAEVRKRLHLLKESGEIKSALCGYLNRRVQIEGEYAENLLHLASLHQDLTNTLRQSGFHS